jgi:hypothetical protein
VSACADSWLAIGPNLRRQWLKVPPPDETTIARLSGMADALPTVEPPPVPWHDWNEVRRVRDDLWGYRTLFLHQTKDLTTDEQHTLAELLACTVGHALRVARTFLETWFAIWQNDLGQRRTPDEAERRSRVAHRR